MNNLSRLCKLILCTLTVAACTSRSKEPMVRLAYPSSGTIMSAQVGLILEKTDILKKHGFQSSVHGMGTGREMKIALVSGDVDVILTSEGNFVVLLGEGFAAEAIGTLGSAGRLALVVAADSKIKDLADLKGKTIATIYGTSLHQPALRWAKEAGGAEVSNIAQVGTMMAALKSGQVAAIVTWDPFLEQAVQNGEVKILREDHFDLISVAASKFVHDNPGAVNRLNDAIREAVVYYNQNKSKVNQWFSEMAGMKADVIAKATEVNHNAQISRIEDVQLTISGDYQKHLEDIGRFLLAEKLIRVEPSVAAHILKF